MQSFLLAAILIGPASDLEAGGFAADVPTAKAAITTRNGNKVPLKVPVGGALFLSAKTATHGGLTRSVTWVVTNPIVKDKDGKVIAGPRALNQRCETITLLDDDDSKNPCLLIPYGNDFTSFNVQQYVSLGDEGAWTEIDIIVEGGIPPPDEDKKDDDDKKPPPPTPAKYLRIYCAFDALNPTVDQSIVRNATGYWKSVEGLGHYRRFFDKQTPETQLKEIAAEANKVDGPVILIYDRDTGKFLGKTALPKSITEVDAYIESFLKK